jgi:hypothetical protein
VFVDPTVKAWGFFWLQACCACDSGVIFSGETLTYRVYARAIARKNALLSLRSRRPEAKKNNPVSH